MTDIIEMEVLADETPVDLALGNSEEYTKGYDEGVTDGEKLGYDKGYADGEPQGYNKGYIEGNTTGFESGQISVLENSKYMNGKASGAVVSVNDVTPIEHNVGVKLENKNLYNINATTECYTSSFALRPTSQWSVENETLFVKYGLYGGAAYWNTNITHLPKGPCTLSCDVYIDEETDTTSKEITLGLIIMKDGNKTSREGRATLSALKTWERVSYTFNLTEDVEIMALQMQGVGNASNYANLDVYFKNIKLVLGTETAYTPFITDFTGVEVARYGGNLIDCNSIVSHNNDVSADFVAGDNSFTMRGNEGTDNLAYNTGQLMFPYGNIPNITSYGTPVKQGITYTVSFDYLLLEQGKWDNRIEAIIYTDTLGIENNKSFGGTLGKIERYSITFTASKDEKVGLSFRVNNNYVNISNIILAVGEQTKYEPYKEPIIHTANADGTVEGVKSISPNMTLIPNSNAVTIECEYLRDIDLYIDNLITDIALTGGV